MYTRDGFEIVKIENGFVSVLINGLQIIFHQYIIYDRENKKYIQM